jgi:UDP-glucuronate 4-epimerase
MQDTDVYKTFADTTKLNNLISYTPQTTIHEGLENFCEWYLKYKNS